MRVLLDISQSTFIFITFMAQTTICRKRIAAWVRVKTMEMCGHRSKRIINIGEYIETAVQQKTVQLLSFSAVEVDCPELSPPPGTHVEKLNTGDLIVQCDTTSDRWNMRCINGEWLQYRPEPHPMESFLGGSFEEQIEYGECKEGKSIFI